MNGSDTRAPGTRRVIVAGEFSAGKSSLVNLLLRRPVLVPSVGLTSGPVIRIRDGTAQGAEVVSRDGSLTAVSDLSAALRIADVSEIEVTTEIEVLPGSEIVELPAPPEGPLPEPWRNLAVSAGLFIWCTIASQAWRLSEKAVVEQLPNDMRKKSVLAVTRSDLLRSDSDRQKIADRLSRDAGPFFADVVFTSAGGGRLAQLQDGTVWQSSGGAALWAFAREVGTIGPAGADPSAPVQQAEPPAAASSADQGTERANLAAAVSQHTSTESHAGTAVEAASSPEHYRRMLDGLAALPGFIAACVTETESAVCCANIGDLDFDLISARSSLFLRLQQISLPAVCGDHVIEDIVISTRKQFQLLCMLESVPHRHVVLLISRSAGNLAQARIAVRSCREAWQGRVDGAKS